MIKDSGSTVTLTIGPPNNGKFNIISFKNTGFE